jgi:diguanylate cyclase (GGDEF)-like protein
MRLARLFVLTTGILLVMVLVMLTRSMLQDWHTMQSARQGLQTMELTYRAMKVAEKTSAERGPAIPVLNDTEPRNPAKKQRLLTAREASDAAMNDALQGLDTLGGATNATYQAAAAQLRKARDELTEARKAVDRVAALPYAERTAPGARLTRKPIDLMFGVIDTVLEGVTALSAETERIYPDLSLPLVGARYGAELREYAGRLGSQFTAPLAAQIPLGAEERRDIPLLVGRIEQLRKLIEVQSRIQLPDPRIQGAIAEMNKRYFGTGLPFIGELTEAGLAGRPYGIESTAFVARYVPEMLSIVQLRDTMFQVARDGAAAQLSAARRSLLLNAAIGLIILLIEIAVFIIIQRYVLRPLLLNTRAMVAIMSGKTDTRLPHVTRTDEIGDMQKAVAALRDISKSKQALETEREQLIDQLKIASNLDFLTKLRNRRAFADDAARQLAQAKRHNWQVALILFDIDHFKQVNDNHGHDKGDAVLIRMAEIAQSQCREADILARYGGEEFIIMAFDCSADDAMSFAERVRTVLARAAFTASDGTAFYITASFGVVTARAGDVSRNEALVRVADQALYRAKSEGRNRIVHSTFDPLANTEKLVANALDIDLSI